MSIFLARVRNVRADLLIVGAALGLALVGLIYFNWLVAVSRSVSPY
ncbi:MAG: hypothetical protein U1E67_01970 [Hyphomicrobiales bacterium]